MIEKIQNKRKLIVVLYLMLTFFKLFTVEIDRIREEDPTIYFKLYPSVENQIKPIIDPGELSDYYCEKYPWYKNGQYFEIIHFNGHYSFIYVYYFLMSFWWVFSGTLIIYAIIKLLKRQDGDPTPRNGLKT